jgi:signal transduction histidine kinase
VSIRVRLALFGILVVTLTLVVFTLAFFGLLEAAGGSGQDQQLAERARQAVGALSAAGPEAFAAQEGLAPLDAAQSNEMFLIVLARDGAVISSTGVADGGVPSVPVELLARVEADGSATGVIEAAPGVRIRVHLLPWQRPDLGLSGYVAAAQSTGRVENDLAVARVFVVAAAVFAFLVAALAIWLVIGRALRPLRRLAALTDDVGRTQDLGRRLPVPPADDEVRRLSLSFNGMMARLEEARSQLTAALDSQKRFVADASHELRTPLTTIRSNAGFLLQHPDAREQDREAALRDIADESERVSRLIQDLLTLARADGGFRLERAALDLRGLVEDVARQAEKLYTTRDIRSNLQTATVDGNADALKQLLWILLDNAARHTSDGGRIRIAMEQREGYASLMVADDGDGIPEDDIERVFDRFYQANAARSGGASGLGLSIARWIVEEHEGRISANNNDHGGATLRVELPMSVAGSLVTVPPAAAAGPEPGAIEQSLPRPTA